MNNSIIKDPLVEQFELLNQDATAAMQYLANNYDKEQILKLTIKLNELLRKSEDENHKLIVGVAKPQGLVKLADDHYCKLLTQYANFCQENEKIEKQRKQIDKQTNQYIAILKEQNNEMSQSILQIKRNDVFKDEYIRNLEKNYKNLQQENNQLNEKIIKIQQQIDTQQKSFQSIDQLVRELSEKYNKLQEITIQQQIENLDENSMRIEVDVPQFKENIQNLNMEREQTIKYMKDLLKEFQSNNQQNINRVNNINEQRIQNIINTMKNVINYIKNVEQSIEITKKNIIKFFKNQNSKEKNTMQLLVTQLDQNKNCFNHVRPILEDLLNVFNYFGVINEQLYSNNQILENQLQNLNNRNNDFEKKIESLINELDQKNEEKKIIKEQVIYSQENRIETQSLNNLNQYSKLQNQFFDKIKDNIGNMLIFNLNFFVCWIFHINSKQQNTQSLESTKNFILGLQDQKNKIELDSMQQQLKKNLEFIEQIYSQHSRYQIFNKCHLQNLQSILKILQTIQNYKKEIENHEKTIQKTN
ncbi:unnamed protein product [Paramecium primaurelia]|uniref:Uncharacterized protein n=1 Tax=Paramecium primaurelia TaxID=5886 RepID=A0A8S1PEF3_PARPR|nr:unnamed protein product [Paramecium primaurelia]